MSEAVFADLLKNHAGAILVDAGWHFATWSDKGRDRCPDKHYRTMTTPEIMKLPVASLAARDSVLFLWATWPLIEDAFAVMKARGFTYKTCAFCWTKVNDGQVQLGTGYWTRANSEPCLLGTRGHPKRRGRDVPQAIIEPRREHSRKPDCVHERIERLVDGPYLELFARQTRPGWTCWGDEVSKFDRDRKGGDFSVGQREGRLSERFACGSSTGQRPGSLPFKATGSRINLKPG